jgi:hypothetical protein
MKITMIVVSRSDQEDEDRKYSKPGGEGGQGQRR